MLAGVNRLRNRRRRRALIRGEGRGSGGGCPTTPRVAPLAHALGDRNAVTCQSPKLTLRLVPRCANSAGVKPPPPLSQKCGERLRLSRCPLAARLGPAARTSVPTAGRNTVTSRGLAGGDSSPSPDGSTPACATGPARRSDCSLPALAQRSGIYRSLLRQNPQERCQCRDRRSSVRAASSGSVTPSRVTRVRRRVAIPREQCSAASRQGGAR